MDISNNPKLKTSEIITLLSESTSLLDVSMFCLDNKAERNPVNEKYRTEALDILLIQNRELLTLDKKHVTVLERVHAFTIFGKLSTEQAEQYKFRLLLVYQAVSMSVIKFSPEMVNIGKQYDPSKLTVLSFVGVHLKSKACNFDQFVNLELLNLSHNSLTTLKYTGLEKCLKLKRFDASYNKIKDDAVYVYFLVSFKF